MSGNSPTTGSTAANVSPDATASDSTQQMQKAAIDAREALSRAKTI
jgi:hypothetical protein